MEPPRALHGTTGALATLNKLSHASLPCPQRPSDRAKEKKRKNEEVPGLFIAKKPKFGSPNPTFGRPETPRARYSERHGRPLPAAANRRTPRGSTRAPASATRPVAVASRVTLHGATNGAPPHGTPTRAGPLSPQSLRQKGRRHVAPPRVPLRQRQPPATPRSTCGVAVHRCSRCTRMGHEPARNQNESNSPFSPENSYFHCFRALSLFLASV